MHRLPYPADNQADVLNRYRLRGIQKVESSGKAKYAMVMCRMLGLVGGRIGATVGRIQAEFGKREIVKDGSIG